MKAKLILLTLTLLSSCMTIDSEQILKSIVNVDNLSAYEYKFLFVRDTYETYPFTIYFKIDIDSSHYNELKSNYISDCSNIFENSKFIFESQLVSLENYSEFTKEKIPDWFDTRNPEIDIWAFYNIENLKLNDCVEKGDAWVLVQYFDKNCYIILDVFPSATTTSSEQNK